jgi:hypothetical protein
MNRVGERREYAGADGQPVREELICGGAKEVLQYCVLDTACCPGPILPTSQNALNALPLRPLVLDFRESGKTQTDARLWAVPSKKTVLFDSPEGNGARCYHSGYVMSDSSFPRTSWRLPRGARAVDRLARERYSNSVTSGSRGRLGALISRGRDQFGETGPHCSKISDAFTAKE